MPPPHKPKWYPTAEEMKTIETLAGVGLTEEKIASILGVSESTFQRACRARHGALRETLIKGRSKADAEVGKRLFTMAINGKNPAATIFWAKVRLGMKESPQQHQMVGRDGKPVDPSGGEVKVVVTLPDNGRKDVE